MYIYIQTHSLIREHTHTHTHTHAHKHRDCHLLGLKVGFDDTRLMEFARYVQYISYLPSPFCSLSLLPLIELLLFPLFRVTLVLFYARHRSYSILFCSCLVTVGLVLCFFLWFFLWLSGWTIWISDLRREENITWYNIKWD